MPKGKHMLACQCPDSKIINEFPIFHSPFLPATLPWVSSSRTVLGFVVWSVCCAATGLEALIQGKLANWKTKRPHTRPVISKTTLTKQHIVVANEDLNLWHSLNYKPFNSYRDIAHSVKEKFGKKLYDALLR